MASFNWRDKLAVANACLIAWLLASQPSHADDGVQVKQPQSRLTLIAEQSDVVTPTGIDVDEKGQIWVVSSHTHFRPENYDGPEHDEVVVLSADGSKRRVFYNKTTATMDLELGDEGWVYLAERSRVLRVRDTDNDGVGDQEQVVAKLTTEATYPHNGISGLCWHPTGDLLFALGENYASQWTMSSADAQSKIQGSGEGGMFRCRPDGSQLRRIARGFWNPFGVCVGPDDELFACENDPGARPPCRLLHVVEGGDYGYQRRYGPAAFHPFVAWNGELPGTLPMLTAVAEAPCGIAKLGHGVLVGSWTEHRIDYYPLTPSGASYQTKRVSVVAGDRDFRPTCLTMSAPGVYYFADWVKGSYQLHGHGRVWKLEVDTSAAWVKPSDETDSATHDHDGLSAARRMRQGLGESRLETLLQRAASEDPFESQAAIAAMAAPARHPEVRKQLSKKAFQTYEEKDRLSLALAVRASLEAKDDGRNVEGLLNSGQRDEWLTMLLKDPAASVQVEALHWIADEQLDGFQDTVQALMTEPRFEIFEASLATWNSLNGNAAKGLGDAAILLPIVRDQRRSPAVRAYALRLLPSPNKQVKVKDYRDWLMADEPLRTEAVRSLAASPSAAHRRLLAEVATGKSPRLAAEALVGLAAAPNDHWELIGALVQHPHAAVAQEALRAIRNAKNPQKATVLGQVTSEQHADLVEAALEPKSLADNRPPATNVKAWMQRLEAVDGKADVEAGRRIFFNRSISNCSNCHRHSGRGSVVGPDLSAIGNRATRESLLREILQPSRTVAPQYRPRQLLTDDGEVFVGLLLRDGGGGKEVYRNDQGREQVFQTEKIVRRKELSTSMMPERLPLMMTDRELRDLLAFLLQPRREPRD